MGTGKGMRGRKGNEDGREMRGKGKREMIGHTKAFATA